MSHKRLSSAVMNQRREPPGSLDFFPTPPWATRALLRYVIPDANGVVWEPAAGEGHMSLVLDDYFGSVYATDVFDYGGLDAVGSFVGVGPDVVQPPRGDVHWVITNPPFNLSLDFVLRALEVASDGVAVLVRSNWWEGVERYEKLFNPYPPWAVAQFVERVPMVRGRWDPDASSATSYSWFVWRNYQNPIPGGYTKAMHIPPGCRQRLERPSDREVFASPRGFSDTWRPF